MEQPVQLQDRGDACVDPAEAGSTGASAHHSVRVGGKAHLSRPLTSIALRRSRQDGSAISFYAWSVIEGVDFLLSGCFSSLLSPGSEGLR